MKKIIQNIFIQSYNSFSLDKSDNIFYHHNIINFMNGFVFFYRYIGDNIIMSIPIIFTHTNNAIHLQIALLQAKKVCRENICLLGDNSNTADFIKHFLISEFDNTPCIQNFEKVFKNLSPNSYQYELFCFKRWFLILEFCQKNNLSECFCLDSDVLIYKDLNELSPILRDKGFSIIRLVDNFVGPQCSYFKTEYLEQFCKFVTDMYTNHFDTILDIYNQLQKDNNISGISDMVLLALFCHKHPTEWIDFDYHSGCAFCFDENIVCPAGFIYHKGFKKLKFINNVPFCTRQDTNEQIPFYILHFQGAAKPKMLKYNILSLSEKLQSPYYIKLRIRQSKIKSLLPKSLKTHLKTLFFKK